MTCCCCPHSADAGRLFSRLARRYRRRYQRAGLEASQRQLIEGLRRAGFEGRTLLEIGSGVGYLHQLLLEAGARRAVGIELAEAMIVEAREQASARGLEGRTEYHAGDFTDLADTLAPADVTILDKVICCYPDAERLVHCSLAKTRRVYALTLPRNRWYTRLGVGLIAAGMRLIGSRFRPYVYDPEHIARWVTAAGFRMSFEAKTLVWLTRIYTRDDPETERRLPCRVVSAADDVGRCTEPTQVRG